MGATASLPAVQKAVRALTRQGSSDASARRPTSVTSMQNTAAARGVPNRALNTALIPVRIMVFSSSRFRRSARPRALPMLPPS